MKTLFSFRWLFILILKMEKLMRYLEVRRHTKRKKPQDHINQEGVTLARNVGNNMGKFDKVVTSTIPRAFETAIAMGYAVDDQIEDLSEMPDEVNDEFLSNDDFKGLVESVKKSKLISDFAIAQANVYKKIVESIPENGKALVIGHGCMVEIATIKCLPNKDFSNWGSAFSHCEGVLLSYDKGSFVDAKILRVS